VTRLKRRPVLAILLLGIIIGGAFSIYEVYYAKGNPPSCQAIPGGSVVRSQTTKVQFGAVTEYNLPGMDRWPTAVTTAQDGSVWFAEQEVPGVAHFFPNNGTVVEHAWTGYPAPKLPDCIPSVIAGGIALWNGRVWAPDEYGHSVVGISPGGGTPVSVNTTGKADLPYWLAVGPEGSLWFTSINEPAKLGRIAPDMTLTTISLAGLGHDEPFQLDFVNKSLAYLSTINQSQNSTTKSCICNGHIYSFDPSLASTTITPALVSGVYNLVLPTSVLYSAGSLWIAQHGASSVVRYDLAAKSWTKYPTSTLPWLQTTLPLLIDGNKGTVWFNEHYANKIGLIDQQLGTLTEYSESNPPASNYTDIQNDLNIAATGGGLWFTSASGNYLGFVSGSYDPGIHLSLSGTNMASISPGGSASFVVKVAGTWSSPMKVTFSDSEDSSSKPKLIQIVPSVPAIPVGGPAFSLGVSIAVDQKTRVGSYTVAVTVTNGLVQQTVYYFVVVK
jgi:streptogramin lyase